VVQHFVCLAVSCPTGNSFFFFGIAIFLYATTVDVMEKLLEKWFGGMNVGERVLGNRHWFERIDKQLKTLARRLEASEIAEYVQLLNHPFRLIVINIVTGIARGVGIAIGFTLFASFIVYALQRIGALNLPVIGNFVAEIVKIVQAQLDLNRPTY